MNDKVKRDILSVLNTASKRIRVNDFATLKDLSNMTIHNASIFQDSDSISAAVIMYALSKIVDRTKEPTILNRLLAQVDKCAVLLERNKLEAYRNSVRSIFKMIAGYDDKFKLYIDEVLEKSQVKKGSMLHEHGISVARTANLLGVGQWELMSYIGKTRIHDQMVGRVDIRKRIEFTRSLFN